MDEVDLIVLSRDEGPLDTAVQRGVDAQQRVRIHLHRVFGRPRSTDQNRWETIARARNEGKGLGRSAWLMFLDDDVILAPDCIYELVRNLQRKPLHGALAADYLREDRAGHVPRHVGLGATLFRRRVLDRIRFRWEDGRCECQCCCNDLRRRGLAIGYCPQARAEHRSLDSHGRNDNQPACSASASDRPAVATGYVLAAFDRNHYDPFRHQFLVSLRKAGNQEPVLAVTYGLYPSQERALGRIPNLILRALPPHRSSAPIRRLLDFQSALADLPAELPVAYWDAGDVLFQGSLQKLWQNVHRHPNQLLVVREPFMHPENTAIAAWTLSIRDPGARHRAFRLLSQRPQLNAGFAAGTVATMQVYLQGAHELLHSSALRGTSDWGDQTAMNLFCHTRDDFWQEVEEGWNYCLCGRRPNTYSITKKGLLVDHQGKSVYAVHGNAKTIPRIYRLRHYRQNPLLVS